jgi:hypothetical protein
MLVRSDQRAHGPGPLARPTPPTITRIAAGPPARLASWCNGPEATANCVGRFRPGDRADDSNQSVERASSSLPAVCCFEPKYGCPDQEKARNPLWRGSAALFALAGASSDFRSCGVEWRALNAQGGNESGSALAFRGRQPLPFLPIELPNRRVLRRRGR